MQDRSRKIFGFILIFVGILMGGATIELFYFDVGDFLRAILPMGIILLGVWLMVRRKRQDDKLKEKYGSYEQEIKAAFHTQDEPKPAEPDPNMSGFAKAQSTTEEKSSTSDYDNRSTQSPKRDQSGKIKYNKLFGDIFIDLTNVNAQNVEVSMFIGDCEIKIHGAKLSEGLNRIIISSFIGDIRIFTPKSMPVFVHCSNFIGDIDALGKRSSGFGNNLESQTQSYDSSAQKIYIACNSFIGDIKVLEI